MSATLTAKQMRQLLQNISADPQLKQSQDSILLAEDQYPDALEAIFTRLTVPTTMQNTMHLHLSCIGTVKPTVQHLTLNSKRPP